MYGEISTGVGNGVSNSAHKSDILSVNEIQRKTNQMPFEGQVCKLPRMS